MRLFLSALGATVVVVAMVLIGLSFFEGPVDNSRLRQGMEITPLPDNSRTDVADWLQETRGDLDVADDEDPVPRIPVPPRFELERPDIVGFVQLVFTVDVDGNPSDIRVFGAVPAGYYEREAIAQVAARRYEPDRDEQGRAVPRRATEVVEFRLPSDTPRYTDADPAG